MAAFREAGARKRSMTNGSEDTTYEREKKREREKEMMRQERIRERMPGRKATGKAKAGDIDGECFDHICWYCSFVCWKCILAILDQIKDEWEFVTDPDVRRRFCCHPVAEQKNLAIISV
jgi:exocyst complex component 4